MPVNMRVSLAINGRLKYIEVEEAGRQAHCGLLASFRVI